MQTLHKTRGGLTKLFPIPKYLTLYPVAIDISNETVRVMHLNKESGMAIPDIYKEVQLKEYCHLLEREEDLNSCSELKEVLKNLKEEFNLKYVNISIPESKTYVFKTSVPKSALSSIEDTLLFKIEENVPLAPQDIVFDYNIIPNSTLQEYVDVVVTTLPKKIIEIYSSLLDQVGLIPLSFVPESHALAEAVVPKHDPSPYLILHLKKSDVGMSIVEHNVVHYTSTFPSPSEDVVKDLNSRSAHAMKEQINKLLIFWFTNQNRANPQDKIQNVIITGSYALAPGLTTFLERRLKINVKVADVWSNCFSLNEYIPMISHKKSLDYGTSIGLALSC